MRCCWSRRHKGQAQPGPRASSQERADTAGEIKSKVEESGKLGLT